MSYFKCRDCNYFEKDFLVYSWCTYKQECTIGMGSPCSNFITTLKMCGECSRYKDNGKCTWTSGKRYSNHPACGGFKPQEDCFLTSACVKYQGKTDDCEELTVLRQFRDGYMRTIENGETLIKEYYESAPIIVEKINASAEKDSYYEFISKVVDKCVKLITVEDNESALNEYKFMVNKLKTEFGV